MPPKKETAKSENAAFAFVEGDLVDLPGLAAKLRGAQDPVSQYLDGGLGPETRRLLDRSDSATQSSGALAKALADEFNKVIEDSAFYDVKRFAEVALSEKTRSLTGKRLSRAEVVPDSPPKIVGMAFVGLQQVWGVNRGVDRALRGVSERIGNG